MHGLGVIGTMSRRIASIASWVFFVLSLVLIISDFPKFAVIAFVLAIYFGIRAHLRDKIAARFPGFVRLKLWVSAS